MQILALLADALIEIQEQGLDDDNEVVHSNSMVFGSFPGRFSHQEWHLKALSLLLLQDDWEEVDEGDMESDKGLLYSVADATGRPAYEHLKALAKIYDEVRLKYN